MRKCIIYFSILMVSFFIGGCSGIDSVINSRNIEFGLSKAKQRAGSFLDKAVLAVGYRLLHASEHLNIDSRGFSLYLCDKVGQALVNEELYPKAIAVQGNCTAKATLLYGAETNEVAKRLDEEAITNILYEMYDKAAVVAEMSLSISRRLLDINNTDTARREGRLALIYSNLGKEKDAIALGRSSLSIKRINLGIDNPETIRQLGELGRIIYDSRSSGRALNGMQALATDLAEKYLNKNSEIAAYIKQNMAAHYAEHNECGRSMRLAKYVIDRIKKLYGLNSSRLVNAYIVMAESQDCFNNLPMALRYIQKALDLSRRKYGEHHPKTVVIESSLAARYAFIDKTKEALDLAKKADHAVRNTLGYFHYLSPEILDRLAKLYVGIDNKYALALAELAISSTVNRLGRDSYILMNYYVTAADILNNAGDYKRATQYAEKAADLHLLRFNEAHVMDSDLYHTLTISYYGLDEGKNYVNTARTALNIEEVEWGVNDPALALSYYIYAVSTWPSPYPDSSSKAIALLKKSFNMNQDLFKKVRKLGVKTTSDYFKSQDHRYKTLAEWLSEEGRFDEASEVMSIIKANEYNAFSVRSSMSAKISHISYTTSEVEWLKSREVFSKKRRNIWRAYTNLIYAKESVGINKAQELLKEKLSEGLNDNLERYIDFIKKPMPRIGNASMKVAKNMDKSSLQANASIGKRLPPHVALATYFVTSKSVGIIVSSANGGYYKKVLIDSSDLNKKIAKYLSSITDLTGNPYPIAGELYDLLVRPINWYLSKNKIRTLLLSLDSKLRYMPFSALYDGNRFLAERLQTAIFNDIKPSLKNLEKIQYQANVSVLGFGLSKSISQFKPLPYVVDELNGIVKNKNGSGLFSGDVFMDEDFNKSRLISSLAGGYNILHIASHFVFSPGTERNSFLLMGDGDRLSVGEIRQRKLNFSDIDLLTLSACDTARGSAESGSGVEMDGIGTTVMRQGAKSVIATLWSVADKSTAIFMNALYRAIKYPGLSKAEALQKTQIKFIHSNYKKMTDSINVQGLMGGNYLHESRSDKIYSHPFYWAPFVLIGGWQ